MIDVGAQISWTSSALPYLTSDISEIPITFNESVWLASIDSICTIFGIILYPSIMDVVGRKYTILIFTLIQIIAWIAINLATNFISLLISRIIVGIGYGGIFSFLTIYIGEIAEKNLRGMFLSIDKICVNFGGFILNSVGAFLSYRTMNLVMISIPLISLSLFPLMHETPYYYLMKNREENAIRALMKLNCKENSMVVDDIERIRRTIEECGSSKKYAIQELFSDKGSRRGLIIKIITDLTYAFSGFMVIQTYAQDIFEYTGSSMKPAYSVMLISGVQSLVGFSSGFLVDYWGRRPIYLLSGIMSSISLTSVGVFFFFKYFLEINVDNFSWTPLVLLTFFLIVANMGLSTIPHIYSGELFSVKVKGLAVMISSIFVGFSLFLAKFMTPFLNKLVGIYSVFWLFSSVCFIGPLCIFFIAPETKGKNLEEVLSMLRS
ncbi:facilitated trehalose transporter Tret1-like [Leptopilina heterotoma]|uniref:facilitated trehalose transporter Tret1-like n=1 Tax=Leptopilina heterotoma TaxID=63436 RepID=UPI001CA878C3|nr:facilitated trehalose transporter Tret1-like [Leptopilina heterotoma]